MQARSFLAAAALAAAALIVAHAAGAQAPEKQKITIAVGGKSLIYYLPLTIAERKGFFRAEGLDAEIVDFPGGAKALQAMVGGSADIYAVVGVATEDRRLRVTMGEGLPGQDE